MSESGVGILDYTAAGYYVVNGAVRRHIDAHVGAGKPWMRQHVRGTDGPVEHTIHGSSEPVLGSGRNSSLSEP